MVSKIFITPVSWALAVAVVLVDKALSTAVHDAPDFDDRY